MGYLKLRIRLDNYDLVRVIFSAFYRSLLIYYLAPIYAVGAMTEEEIDKLKTQSTREQYSLKGDVTNQAIK